MFIYQPSFSKELEESTNKIKKEFGVIPLHWKLLASIAPNRFEMFIQEITYLSNHPHINPDFFTMLRLHVANRENFSYCKSLNTKLLLAKGYNKTDIKGLKEDIKYIPLDDKHKLLAQKAIKAMYQSKEFIHEDIKALKDILWSDSDIYDAIDHAAFLFKFSKIIKAYSE
jgi:hypothetical protein